MSYFGQSELINAHQPVQDVFPALALCEQGKVPGDHHGTI